LFHSQLWYTSWYSSYGTDARVGETLRQRSFSRAFESSEVIGVSPADVVAIRANAQKPVPYPPSILLGELRLQRLQQRYLLTFDSLSGRALHPRRSLNGLHRHGLHLGLSC